MSRAIAALTLALLAGAVGCQESSDEPGRSVGSDSMRPDLWTRSDGYTNNTSFHCGWRADHVQFDQGRMTLRLDADPCPSGCSGKPFASGEVSSVQSVRYGRLEGRFKAAKGIGIVTSLFLYDRTSQDEIDIELLGKDPTRLQTNYFTGGAGDHARTVDLGFDASEGFHTYAIDRSPEALCWYVDDRLVHTETGARGPLPTHPAAILANLWPGHGAGTEAWLGGAFEAGAPVTAAYAWIRFHPTP